MTSTAQYLRVADVASRLNVSKMTVYRLCENGTLGHTRVGRSFRIDPDAVERYLAANTIDPHAAEPEPAEPTEPTITDLPDEEWRALRPQTKRRIIEAMGFVPTRAEHTPECPAAIDPVGLRCCCAGEPVMWTGPDDVQTMMGDTYEQRAARRLGAERNNA